MRNFALIGGAGFVAPKHMKAIKETGNKLVAILDLHDSIGIIDRYFPHCNFFTEFERFDRHLEKLRQKGEGVDYVSICSPNYLHDAHCRLAMRVGADAICEKPLVLSPHNLDQLKAIEKETSKRVFGILQLRLHPSLVELKKKVDRENKFYNINLTYLTPRGPWYDVSWKGDEKRSGGILTNIGIHFFDILLWIFGEVEKYKVTVFAKDQVEGELFLDKAHVDWHLSTKNTIRSTPYRSLTINKEEVRFDSGFEDLHTTTYKNILDGKGFSIKDCKPSIELVYGMRTKYASR